MKSGSPFLGIILIIILLSIFEYTYPNSKARIVDADSFVIKYYMDRGNRTLQDPLNGRMYDIIVMHYSESPKKIGVTDVSSIGGNVSSSSHIDNGTIIKIPIGTKDCGFNNTECYEVKKNETIQGTNNTNPFTVKLPILNSSR